MMMMRMIPVRMGIAPPTTPLRYDRQSKHGDSQSILMDESRWIVLYDCMYSSYGRSIADESNSTAQHSPYMLIGVVSSFTCF